jgi:hypothetical protein
LHFGVAPPHWLSSVHLEVQVFVATLQNGVPPPHCALLVHCTQTSVVVLQTGVPPLHAAASVPLHCTHWPPTHAGSVVVGHGEAVAEPLSPVQATQTSPVHTGAVDGHCVESVQDTHLSLPVSQTGVAPVHAVVFVVSHCTHAPALGPVVKHAGSAAGHGNDDATPKSLVQPTQKFVLGSHEPVVPVHADELPAVHCTHAPPRHTGKPAVGHAFVAPELKSPLHGPQPLLMHDGSPGGQSSDVAHV